MYSICKVFDYLLTKEKKKKYIDTYGQNMFEQIIIKTNETTLLRFLKTFFKRSHSSKYHKQ